MPQVRILTPVAGVDFSWTPGEVVDMPAEQAKVWADGVRGELVREEKPRRAARSRPETPEGATS